jgi:hypothetical protein
VARLDGMIVGTPTLVTFPIPTDCKRSKTTGDKVNLSAVAVPGMHDVLSG